MIIENHSRPEFPYIPVDPNPRRFIERKPVEDDPSAIRTLATFARVHGLVFSHKLIPCKNSIIVIGNETRDQRFAVVLGITCDSGGLWHWNKQVAKESPRLVTALKDAGCRYDPHGFFNTKMAPAKVFEFDPNDAEQVDAVLEYVCPKKLQEPRVSNLAGLERYRKNRLERKEADRAVNGR